MKCNKTNDLWVIVETNEDGSAKNVGLELLTPGRMMAQKQGGKLVALVIGYNVDAAVKAAKAEFEKAIEPLEKAHKITPSNYRNLQLLRGAYMQLNQGTKADAIQKEIDNLSNQK